VINLIENEEKFLESEQQRSAKEFLENFTDKDFLNIHKNIYEP
jgi:hypothetical protein